MSCGDLLGSLWYAYSASFSSCLNLHASRVSFFKSSLSPVMAASLLCTPDALITIPSTGMFIPALILTMSPTTRLLWWTVSSFPSLRQTTYKHYRPCSTYDIVLLTDGLELEELFFLLVVVPGSYRGDHKYSDENGSSFDPSYSKMRMNDNAYR